MLDLELDGNRGCCDGNQAIFFDGDVLQQHGGGFVVRVLRDEFAHDGELQDGFAQGFDAFRRVE